MLLKIKIKIYKKTIEKYCVDISIGEIKPLLCKSSIHFFKTIDSKAFSPNKN
jgi:hypothetical protein